MIVPVITYVVLILLHIPPLTFEVGIPIDGDKALPLLRLFVGWTGGRWRLIREVTIHRIDDDPATITENPMAVTTAGPVGGTSETPRVAGPITAAGYMTMAAVSATAATTVTGVRTAGAMTASAVATSMTAAFCCISRSCQCAGEDEYEELLIWSTFLTPRWPTPRPL